MKIKSKTRTWNNLQINRLLRWQYEKYNNKQQQKQQQQQTIIKKNGK